jgi:membrane protease YdiL (CAAX protease family)
MWCSGILWAVKRPQIPAAERAAIDAMPSAWSWRALATALVIIIALGVAFASLIGVAMLWQSLAGMPPRAMPAWWPLLTAVIAAPVIEEIIFRAGVQHGLLQWPHMQTMVFASGPLHASAANLLTAALFALAHVPAQGWVGLATFVPAVAIGMVYDRYRSVLPCIALHCAFNLAWLLAGQLA